MNTEQRITAKHAAQQMGVARDTTHHLRNGKGSTAHNIDQLWKFQLPEVDGLRRINSAVESLQLRYIDYAAKPKSRKACKA
jgi:hypothetical protein